MNLLSIKIDEPYRGPGLEELLEKNEENEVLTVKRGQAQLTTGLDIQEFLENTDSDYDLYDFTTLDNYEIEEYLDEAGWGINPKEIIAFEKQEKKNSPKAAPEFILFSNL